MLVDFLCKHQQLPQKSDCHDIAESGKIQSNLFLTRNSYSHCVYFCDTVVPLYSATPSAMNNCHHKRVVSLEGEKIISHSSHK